MQRSPFFNANRTSPTVHQPDRSPPPSHAVLLKRAAHKTNRRRTPTATVTATTTSSPHPGAMQAPVQFRVSGLRRMQRTPASNANRASPTVHQADRSPPPSPAVLPKRAARKTNRQRRAMATATATATSSPHPGAMLPPMQFRSSSLRRMQRTPSSIGNRASSSVHQADRSPYQIITHYSNELHAKPTDNVQQLNMGASGPKHSCVARCALRGTPVRRRHQSRGLRCPSAPTS